MSVFSKYTRVLLLILCLVVMWFKHVLVDQLPDYNHDVVLISRACQVIQGHLEDVYECICAVCFI